LVPRKIKGISGLFAEPSRSGIVGQTRIKRSGQTWKKKETTMTMMQKGAFALALLGGLAFAPVVQAVEGDVDIDRDADVIIEEDRPGLLPGEPLDRDADVHVEADEPDAYIAEDDDDDIDAGASVEVDPD
jgi:hypothetical protein